MCVSLWCRYPHNTPRTKEAYFYRSIFESLFSQPAAAETVPGESWIELAGAGGKVITAGPLEVAIQGRWPLVLLLRVDGLCCSFLECN